MLVTITSGIPSTAKKLADQVRGGQSGTGRREQDERTPHRHGHRRPLAHHHGADERNDLTGWPIRLLHQSDDELDSNWRNLEDVTPSASFVLPKPTIAATAGDKRLAVAIQNLHANADGGWQLEWATNSGFTAGLSSRLVPRPATSTNLTGLTNGTTYHLRATQLAGNRANTTDSAVSDTISATPAATLPDLGLLAVVEQAQWSRGCHAGRSLHANATGWELEYGRTTRNNGVANGRGTKVTDLPAEARAQPKPLAASRLTDTIVRQSAAATSTQAGYSERHGWSGIESIAVGASQLPELSHARSPSIYAYTEHHRRDRGTPTLHAQANRWHDANVRLRVDAGSCRTAARQSYVALQGNSRWTMPSQELVNGTRLTGSEPKRRQTTNAGCRHSDNDSACEQDGVAAYAGNRRALDLSGRRK